MMNDAPLVSADNEWSPLRAVIVGRAECSAFPSEPQHMIAATMPKDHWSNFRKSNPFPEYIVSNAQKELDNLAAVLERNCIKVYRPKKVDWLSVGGYTGSMARDGLMSVGNTLVEAHFAWNCRRKEIELAYSDILTQLSDEKNGKPGRIYRAPMMMASNDTIYDGIGATQNGHAKENGQSNPWAVNNSRPAFDVADFMRFGKTIIGQLSNVTNRKGVDYLQAVIPDGYTVELLDVDDPKALHIDATILPLRQGILVYCPKRVTEKALRRHSVFADWELHAYPYDPEEQVYKTTRTPGYMCSRWLVLNALSLDERRILVEENDTQFAEWVKTQFGMEPIMLPFQHVNSIGGSFHCATVDLVREG